MLRFPRTYLPARQLLRYREKSSGSEVLYSGNKSLGIVREEYCIWERRSPLSPEHVKTLVAKGFNVIVQPCSRRIFSDDEFRKAGATISDNLSNASLIVGVKQIKAQNIMKNKSYMFFR